MGRILTSSTLNVPDFPNVFAVGDCSRPTKVPYPATAQVAIQQATVAAVNIFTTLVQNRKSRTGDDNESKLLRPFKFLNLGEALTLGSDDASISTLGGNVELSGPTASWLRRWLYAARMPTPKQGLVAAVDGTGRKLARGAVRSTRTKSKPIDWK
jgi:NADH dehydrogenase